MAYYLVSFIVHARRPTRSLGLSYAPNKLGAPSSLSRLSCLTLTDIGFISLQLGHFFFLLSVCTRPVSCLIFHTSEDHNTPPRRQKEPEEKKRKQASAGVEVGKRDSDTSRGRNSEEYQCLFWPRTSKCYLHNVHVCARIHTEL